MGGGVRKNIEKQWGKGVYEKFSIYGRGCPKIIGHREGVCKKILIF